MKNLKITKLFVLFFGAALIFSACGKQEDITLENEVKIEVQETIADKVMATHANLAPGESVLPEGTPVFDYEKVMKEGLSMDKCPGCPVLEEADVEIYQESKTCTLLLCVDLNDGSTLYVENDNDAPGGDFQFNGPINFCFPITAVDGDTREYAYFGNSGVTVTTFPFPIGIGQIGCEILDIGISKFNQLETGEVTFSCDPCG